MTENRSFLELNQAATNRLRILVTAISDSDLLCKYGDRWTIAIALAHLAFWDQRMLEILDRTEQAGNPVSIEIDIAINDILLPFWAAIPPRQAAMLAITTAEILDKRLEKLSPVLLEQVINFNQRWVNRYLHRNEHLAEIEAILKT